MGEKKMGLLYEDLTAKILKACFEVSNELGHGFVESVYEKALVIALRQKGLSCERQVPLRVLFRGEVVGDFAADVLVADKIIIELKAVKDLTEEHESQVINYLKATGKEVGLLVNFGRARIQYKRFHAGAAYTGTQRV